MRITSLLLITTVLGLSACSSSHRPVYSGHQESTDGVPGFADGKKLSPYVKLGQSYSVDGEWYVPRYQPDYVEEGVASWYGPGFHGGKTANGETFDTRGLTAAHRTLPLPSIVRVTSLANGKQVYVRINDRGPFARGRIIDLSYTAAKELEMIGKGTGRVRVEYLPQASQRFVDLLTSGRSPNDINLASEVLNQPYRQPVMVARQQPPAAAPVPSKSPSLLSRLNPIATAHAEEMDVSSPVLNSSSVPLEEEGSAPAMDITASDLPAPAAVPKPEPLLQPVPATQIQPVAGSGGSPALQSVPPAGNYYIQLGAFLQELNAERLRRRAAGYGPATIAHKAVDGNNFFVVRLGPYATVDESTRVLAQLNGLGVHPKLVAQ